VARVDLRMDEEGRIYVLEVNPLPGLTPNYSDLVLISQAAGMDYDQLMGEIMMGGLRRLREKRREARASEERFGNGRSKSTQAVSPGRANGNGNGNGRARPPGDAVIADAASKIEKSAEKDEKAASKMAKLASKRDGSTASPKRARKNNGSAHNGSAHDSNGNGNAHNGNGNGNGVTAVEPISPLTH
jgi:hypothetical protein